jgi:hypothetical protein
MSEWVVGRRELDQECGASILVWYLKEMMRIWI